MLTIKGRPCLTIASRYKDGIAETSINVEKLSLSDYGLYALKKNIKCLLEVIENYESGKIQSKSIEI